MTVYASGCTRRWDAKGTEHFCMYEFNHPGPHVCRFCISHIEENELQRLRLRALLAEEQQ